MTDWLNIPWWGWTVFGILLALLELASPGGFFFLFFGASAVLVGALAWTGLVAEPWVQVTFFSIFSVVASLLFRKPLMARFGPRTPDIPVDSLIGETATVLDDIPVNGFGKVELRGSTWSAKNNGDQILARGQRCRVERLDGLSVWVRAE